MTSPTLPKWPDAALGMIPRFGYDYLAIADGPDRLVLKKINARGEPHRTGRLTWDAATDTFSAAWDSEAYPHVEPGSFWKWAS
ncbi:hypothetical protein GCM10029992_36360 [Glycomyces albus]